MDSSLAWAEYERFLLSRSRATPLLLYFAPDPTCFNDEGEDEGEDDQVQTATKPLTPAQQACVRHGELLESAMERAAETLSRPQPPVVRVDVRAWPKMLHYHLVSTTPSLLWMPGRSSGRFQRYPHVETNFLELSINGSLFAGKLSDIDFSEGREGLQQSGMAKDAVAAEVTAFVRLCQERSGYLVRNARGGLSPAVPVSHSPGEDAFSVLELIPIFGFLAFIAFVINENREFVMGVVRTKLFWFVLCLGVIYVALSGLFHSIIHQRAWYYFGRVHGFVFVYPSSRRQFVLEGLVNGTWSFWLSLGVMSISDVAPTLRSRLAREEVIRWSLLLVVVSYMALYMTFLMKYRWLA
ncbi:Oligosaccharyl transferase complex, subunit OST3/OST6 [Phytophthora cinnamomi]|uniref:Oligosaccharyl transferase complex, subunit OST3/OST6 n=1 Tax=Phytophthora cinnamomi TaxID=4785 RepID=UPI00355A030F|nr:Oligosaccharyl transferase complex, subunit OST3/OST6 [Phytophthora cinnamomi]